MITLNGLQHILESFVINMSIMSVIYILIIRPIENRTPRNTNKNSAKKNADIRFDLRYSIFYFSINILVISPLFWLIGTALQPNWGLPALFKDAIATLPMVIQIFLAIVVFDVGYYWLHLWSHRWRGLWLFHATHHSTEHMHALAGFRIHIVSSILTRLIAIIPLGLLGFNPIFLSYMGIVHAYLDSFIHMDTKLRFGILDKIIVTPHFHLWHHEKVGSPKNLAIVLPVIDMIFGTFYLPKEVPDSLGLQEEKIKNSIATHQLYPITWLIKNITK
jgi:sterol desaturase/sphingolipid hydroxylase (fatty acid hydroxylase superfamily)